MLHSYLEKTIVLKFSNFDFENILGKYFGVVGLVTAQ